MSRKNTLKTVTIPGTFNFQNLAVNTAILQILSTNSLMNIFSEPTWVYLSIEIFPCV